MDPDDRHERFLTYFLRHQDEIAAVVGSMVRDPHLREDIVQEVAMVLWRKFDEYDPSRSFGAWARGIAVRKVLQAWARQQRLPAAMAPDTMEAILTAFDETEEESPTWGERQAALEDCMAELPDRSRRLLELRYRHGLSLHDIAAQVRSTLDAVNKALSRLRQALRECVERRLAEAGG